MKSSKFSILIATSLCLGLGVIWKMAGAHETGLATGPDPREISVPRIKTVLGTMPGVRELPVRKEMPDVMMMSNGLKISSPQQWNKLLIRGLTPVIVDNAWQYPYRLHDGRA
jgi:hypothetical protein